MTISVVRKPDEMERLRGDSWGLVPTMGALHAGHLTLISRAAAENDAAVVSIFVNPTQFGNANDLSRYPRNLDQDVDMAEAAGASIIYAPEAQTVYPPGFSTWVDPGALAERWEGRSRPGHFRGVATVVTILLNTVQPRRSYFGEKDFQQLEVIRRMHRELHLPGQVIASPTVRDMDGLALSSRNARLSSAGRATAQRIPLALAAMIESAQAGIAATEDLISVGKQMLDHPEIHLDYLAIVDSGTLEPIMLISDSCRIILAVEIDGVRLIDNAAIALPTDPCAGRAA